jgi:phosphomannomutase / phosphoglucomutase
MANPYVNPHIFRAYDIRGIAIPTEKFPTADLTQESTYYIGLATGIYMQRTYQTKSMVIGRDNRLTSPELQKTFIEGALDSGLNVTDIGLATTPMMYYAICKYGFDSGINITASHNPKEYNGIKVNRTNAASVADKELQQILQLIQKNDLPKSPVRGILVQKDDVFNDYVKDIAAIIHLSRPLKIVVDAGNGIAGTYAPKIFRTIGCEVTELYCEPDGNFPNHEANPEEAHNMVDLGKKVIEVGAELGIGLDGDGDRIGIVDHEGKHYSAEYAIMLLARDLLESKPGSKVIFDIKASMKLINDIKNHGGIPLINKTGHSFIEERLRNEKATLAGETSGHLFFGKDYYNYFGFDDAIFGSCKTLEIISKSSKKFPEHFTDLPILYSTPEIKIPCPDNRKFEIVEEIKNHFISLYDCITIDGVRVNMDENSWGAIRCSNTTPNLTARFEADSEAKLTNIKNIFFSELKKYPEVELPN